MSIDLNNCKEITSSQYCELPGTPEFMGQTRMDSNDMYWMLSKSDNVLYKVRCKL